MKELETSHLGKMFVTVFFISLIINSLVFNIFGMEVFVIFFGADLVASICTALVGVENIIILSKK